MVIYNITTLVDPSILNPWLTWMREEHLPRLMETGCFLRSQFVRLLDTDETHGLTFAIQLYAENRAACDHFAEAFEPSLERESRRLWGEKSLSFRTLMEVVN